MSTTTPTITSSSPASSLKEELLLLDQQRAELMQKIQDATLFLSTTPVGLTGSLINDEGFPRDDCDLYAIRTARHTINCGKNDLKNIEIVMHEKLAQLHEENQEQARLEMQRDDEARRNGINNNNNTIIDARQELIREMSRKSPFVRIIGVSPGSPGAEAGFIVGDVILQFGELDATRGVSEMSFITRNHEGRPLSVWIKRGIASYNTNTHHNHREMNGNINRNGNEIELQEVQELFVIPRRWDGEGLLGCAFEPVR